MFVLKYPIFLDMIEKVVKEEYQPAILRLRETDPHDLVTPSAYFDSPQSALGYVFNLLLLESRK